MYTYGTTGVGQILSNIDHVSITLLFSFGEYIHNRSLFIGQNSDRLIMKKNDKKTEVLQSFEMMIAVAIFLIVVTMGVGALVTLILVYQRSQGDTFDYG